MVACPLCSSKDSFIFYLDENFEVFQCNECALLYKNPNSYITQKEELNRYLKHNNDVEDKGYQSFVTPIVKAIQHGFPISATGLDFGAGTGPVITKMLSEKGYFLSLYDTFFHPNQEALQQQYDFIICCEVMEHFHQPNEEFTLLKKLLKSEGKLYCMTEIYSETIDFETWYYKNDETHVVFYTKKTINWIQQRFHFSKVKIDENLIVFST